MTVNDCRRREDFHKNSKPSKELSEEMSEGQYKLANNILLHYDLLYATIQWYEDKERTIDGWIERDTRKDELYENAEAPRDIRCLKCQSLTVQTSKILYDHFDGQKDRVLFMYDCPNKCVPRRSFFDDGEEYKIKPRLCSKCNSNMDRSSERIEDKKIITTETCTKCGHVETDELDLTIEKEKAPDPDYEKDKERFCLSGENLSKNLKEKSQLEGMAHFMDKLKEKEMHKEEHKIISDLKKLTVVALENLLVPLCEKEKYAKFQFGTPDMGKDLFLPFTVHEANPERVDYASSQYLQKIIKKALEDTNWRLMSDGISYRMGILSGRLRAYEREEDLMELAKQALKKVSKKP